MHRSVAHALLLAPFVLAAPHALAAQAGTPSPAASAPAAPSAANVAAANAQLDRLRWLTGCWELRTPTRVTHESWIAPSGGLMLGNSRTVAREVTREFEFLRIETRSGTVTYVAQPGGGAPTPFPATSVSDTLVVFDNPQHDFPQRILYRRLGADSLLARIEGPQGGQTRGIDFRMKRIDCGP